MKIGIFGGSFNPIHTGHVKVANEAIKELGLDKLIFVPAYKNPFKNKNSAFDSTHNLKMIEEILLDKCEVSDFELKRKGTSYTIETLKYLVNKNKGAEFYLLIGSDNIAKLHKWKDIDEITSLCQIVVFNRKGSVFKENFKKYNCIRIKNNQFDFSSSDYRAGNISIVDDKVQAYISKHQLYLETILDSFTNGRKLHRLHKHCKVTGALAAQYAKALGENPQNAYMAGILHDLTKGWTIDEHRAFLQELEIDDTQYENHELHSVTASVWLEKVYKLNEPSIIQAIRYHTNLNHELTTMDKIIFMADKLCEGRKWNGIQKIRDLALTDFDAAFKEVVRINREMVLEKNNGKITEKFDEGFKQWIK